LDEHGARVERMALHTDHGVGIPDPFEHLVRILRPSSCG
jgi:hypothetical protein